MFKIDCFPSNSVFFEIYGLKFGNPSIEPPVFPYNQTPPKIKF
jgi:hypothetical protein